MFGSLFQEKVAGAERMSSNIIAPGSPERDWPALLDVPGIERSFGAPQDQERTDYATLVREIRFVVLAINGRGGSILLTGGVCVGRVRTALGVCFLAANDPAIASTGTINQNRATSIMTPPAML